MGNKGKRVTAGFTGQSMSCSMGSNSEENARETGLHELADPIREAVASWVARKRGWSAVLRALAARNANGVFV